LPIGVAKHGACREIQAINMKVGAASQGVAIRLIHRWFDIDEVDATHRLFDMEIAWNAIESHPIPVKNTVGGI
jgi:hypothetical protein